MVEARSGQDDAAAEVAEAAGLSVEQVVEAGEAVLAYRSDSLDRPVFGDGEDGALTVGDRIGSGDPELRRAEDAILLDQLAAAALTLRDREVVRLRFREDLLQREIAQRVGVSQMQISRILRDAVGRLRLACDR